VAIARGAKTLTIGGAAQTLILNQQGQLLDYLAAGTSSIAQLSSTGIQLGAVAAPSTIWVKSNAEQGLIYVDGHWYRGAVQVIVQDQTLLAVNHLDLETYLLSVVGAEMPAHWPSAALQAQAIAARSYALVHIARPASPFYDLGNTERWQVYRGVTTEANTTHAAVSETRGLILSHQGGVVESLYAASDEIVKEVHKGFGMSQEGANQMAQQGFNVQQILNTFYAGTQLAQLRVAP
jgi:peptidoglycan hydrolase-like amidase